MTSAACVPVLAANSAGGRPGIRVPASGCWQQGGRSGTSSCIQVTGWPRAEFPESKGKIVTTSNFFKGIAPKISCAPKPRTRSHIACIYAAPIPTISRRDVCPHGEWTLFFKPFHIICVPRTRLQTLSTAGKYHFATSRISSKGLLECPLLRTREGTRIYRNANFKNAPFCQE